MRSGAVEVPLVVAFGIHEDTAESDLDGLYLAMETMDAFEACIIDGVEWNTPKVGDSLGRLSNEEDLGT